MDDYTWQAIMRERHRRVKRERFMARLFLVLLVGSIIWYFAFYSHTPEYSADKLEEAVQERDLETFKEYVAMDSILSDAYDDLTVDLFQHDKNLTPQTKALFEKFYVLVKPQITDTTENIIYGRVVGDEWKMPEGADMLKGRQLGIDYEEFLEKSLLRSTSIKSFGNVVKNGSQATLELNVVEDTTLTPFTLEFKMEKNEEGNWCVTGINNYRAYLETISPLIYHDVTTYVEATAPIVEKYNETFQSEQWDFMYIGYSAGGQLSQDQRMQLAEYLKNDVIPHIKKRQEELDQISIPPGAVYLSDLRKESTDLSIRIWQHYIHALKDDNISEFNTAESMLKQLLVTEQRIEDIIRRAAVSKNVPDMP